MMSVEQVKQSTKGWRPHVSRVVKRDKFNHCPMCGRFGLWSDCKFIPTIKCIPCGAIIQEGIHCPLILAVSMHYDPPPF